ncbi:MAG TPA: hypothetical protein DCG78_04470 [Anaerolineaceae bacterium]|nr:hypothetical protein [Anaerolineaceae bacterium]
MKKTDKIFYWVITVSFVLLFVFANNIVLSIPLMETYRLEEVESTKYDEYKRDFEAKIETFYVKQDIFFTTEFSGYAFIPTNQVSKYKTIKLIFVSNNKRYEVDTSIIERFNLRDLFRDKGIVGINHGFITRFSPLKMENGVYKLYIYCYENENTIGFMDTNRYFEKTYRTFKEVKN